VQITGTKYASREEDLKDLKIETKADASGVQVRTVRPSMRHGNMGAKYSIRVPQRVELETIRSSNGHIRVEDIEGMRGSIPRTERSGFGRYGGRLDAKTSNGADRGRRPDGRCDAEDVERRDPNRPGARGDGSQHVERVDSRGCVEAPAGAGAPVRELERKPGSWSSRSSRNSEIRATTCNASDHAADSGHDQRRDCGPARRTVRSPASWMWRHRARRVRTPGGEINGGGRRSPYRPRTAQSRC